MSRVLPPVGWRLGGCPDPRPFPSRLPLLKEQGQHRMRKRILIGGGEPWGCPSLWLKVLASATFEDYPRSVNSEKRGDGSCFVLLCVMAYMLLTMHHMQSRTVDGRRWFSATDPS